MKKIRYYLGQVALAFGLVILTAACGAARKGGGTAETPRTPYENRLYDSYYTEAVKQKILGNHDAAYTLLQYCLELNPKAGEALYDLGLYAIYMQNDSLGKQYLERAAALEPDNIWYRETLSSYYLSRSEWAKAQRYLEEMARLNPKRSDVLMRLVSLYQNDRKYAQAIDVLNRIETLEGKSLQVSMDKYWLYMQLKEKERAYAELRALADEFPNDWSYRVILATQYMANDELDQAKRILDEVERKDPENQTLRLALMDYAQATQNDSLYQASLDSLLFGQAADEATRVRVMKDYVSRQTQDSLHDVRIRDTFRRLLADPRSGSDMWMMYAAYQTLKKDHQDSVAVTLNRVLDLEPDNKVALQELIMINIRQQNFPELTRLCQKAIQYYPDMLVFYYYKGLAHYQLDEQEQAVDAFERGLRQDKKAGDEGMVSDMYSILGDLYHGLHQNEKAYAAYDSALVYKDDNLGALNNYAYFLSLENRELDKAQEMSYKTVQIEPDNVTYLDTYAWILFLKGKYTEAKIYMDKVVGYYEKEPQTEKEKENRESVNGGVLEHAGDIYYHCNEPEKALEYWKKAQKLEGTSDLLEEKIKQKKYIAP
ncbi:MAG: hypothetical protein H9789_06475 [Candidatus Paraprevotella stercoravium]|uniref:Tetratricopeptide repeat protein n=2 Tax=Bacteroidales TaxID=171549 RepID=A0ABT7U4G4_9BACE|nr:hypothetical protein [Candidatus Paraprevotella stercoravium]MDM8145410.1 hypothetical protein [Bacteroides eggerthii]